MRINETQDKSETVRSSIGASAPEVVRHVVKQTDRQTDRQATT